MTLSFSQDSNSFAYLLEGPLLTEGVPGIGENVIPCYKGIYQLDDKKIEVFYSTEDIPVFTGWKKLSGEKYSFYRVSDNVLCYVNKDKWSLFISYEAEDDSVYSVADELVKSMLFFAKTEEFFKVSSFPAIINIKR